MSIHIMAVPAIAIGSFWLEYENCAVHLLSVLVVKTRQSERKRLPAQKKTITLQIEQSVLANYSADPPVIVYVRDWRKSNRRGLCWETRHLLHVSAAVSEADRYKWLLQIHTYMQAPASAKGCQFQTFVYRLYIQFVDGNDQLLFKNIKAFCR